MTSLIYVTLFDVAIFLTPVFRSHWRSWYEKQAEIIETFNEDTRM